ERLGVEPAEGFGDGGVVQAQGRTDARNEVVREPVLRSEQSRDRRTDVCAFRDQVGPLVRVALDLLDANVDGLPAIGHRAQESLLALRRGPFADVARTVDPVAADE